MISSVLELFDLNCSDARSACESPTDLSTLFGQPIVGSCIAGTGICICPSGYSGEDDWAHWNDCHIHETRRWEVLLVTTIIDCIALLVIVASLVRLGHRYGFSAICMPLNSDEINLQLTLRRSMSSRPVETSPSRKKSIALVASELLNSMTAGSLDQSNHTSTFIAIAKDRHRKSQSILLLLLFFGFSSLSVSYHAMLLAGFKRYENNLFFDLVLSVGGTFLLWSLWIFMFLWYNSLPSLRYYGKLFNLNGFLVRHPDFVGRMSILHSIAAAFVNLILVVILPAVFPESRSKFDTMFLVSLLVYVVDYITALVIVCTMLLKCFKQSSIYVAPGPKSTIVTLAEPMTPSPKHQESADTQDELRRDPFARARLTVRIIRIFALVCGIGSIGIFNFMTWIPAGRKNLYLFFNVIGWLVAVVILVCSWILVYRTSLRTNACVLSKPASKLKSNQKSSRARGEATLNDIVYNTR